MAFPFRKSVPENPFRRASPGRILAIASGKGGVGKTWLSATLSDCFARAGKRTLLVDGDLGLANADVQLGIAPRADLSAVMSGWIGLEDAITCFAGGAGSAAGFDVLAGRSGTGALADLRNEEVSRLAAGIGSLALQYDIVVIDLAAGIEGNIMRLARSANIALVIANDEPTSMTDAYAFIKILRSYGPAVDTRVAINMADTRVAGRQTYEALARACEKFLGFRPPLAGIIQRDRKVHEAIRRQKTLPGLDPHAQAAIDARQIADSLFRGQRNERGIAAAG